MLIAPPAVREVARSDHESGLNAFDEGLQGAFDKRLLAGSDVDVGDVDQARRHSRGRLYTGLVPEESTESSSTTSTSACAQAARSASNGAASR